MTSPIISILESGEGEVEIVERKGLGHPDSICDALAETFSRNLCREYRRRFGEVLHHNVDKALLCGGSAAPAFGGGNVNQIVVELDEGYKLFMAISDGSSFAVLSTKQCDTGLVAYEMTMLARRVGTVLTPALINELQQMLPTA